MDQIVPGLWIGDISSAHDVEKLKAHGIFSILTAMRGKVTIHEVREDLSTHFRSLKKLFLKDIYSSSSYVGR
jgi:DNA-binding transcriptional regulator YdaS (Cro superfamily)